jgi:6-pyruvoyltetrahydropterin/6-carboxytetrahydropterin synthase
MSFRVVKHYGHNLGWSCCFRQWRADSHCRYMHGYALAFTFTFEANILDKNGWVLDFGGLNPLKEQLKSMFDHCTCIADDDPELDQFMSLDKKGLIRIGIFTNGVGIEKFAESVWYLGDLFLKEYYPVDVSSRGLRLTQVECHEHEANSAVYRREE